MVKTSTKRRDKSRRGTHECVRHNTSLYLMPISLRDPTRFSILTHVDDTCHPVAIDGSTKCIGEPLALYLEGCLKANRVGRDRAPQRRRSEDIGYVLSLQFRAVLLQPDRMRRRSPAEFEMRIPYTTDSHRLPIWYRGVLKFRWLGEHRIKSFRNHLLFSGHQHIWDYRDRAHHG